MDFPATARRLNQRYRPSKHHVSRDKALADWLEMRRPRFLFDSKFCLSHNANYAPPKSPDFDTFKPPVVSESPADMPPDAMQETLLLDEVCHQARGEPELDMDVEDNREPLQVLEYKQWSPLAPQRTVNIQAHEGLPPDFIRATKRRLQEGRLTTDAAQYYLNFSHWDSTTVPGQQGRPSFLKDIMAHDRREKQGPGWRPKRLLGQGSFGKVVLWEKDSRQGPVSPPLLSPSSQTLKLTHPVAPPPGNQRHKAPPLLPLLLPRSSSNPTPQRSPLPQHHPRPRVVLQTPMHLPRPRRHHPHHLRLSPHLLRIRGIWRFVEPGGMVLEAQVATP